MNRKKNKTYFSTSKVMGILNLSDNSFYDGGKYNRNYLAKKRGLKILVSTHPRTQKQLKKYLE